MLSNFTFLPNKNIIQSDLGLDDLKEILIPVWNNEELFLRMFNQNLVNLEEAAKILVRDEENDPINPEIKMEILQYFVGSFFGVRINDLTLKTIIGRLCYYASAVEVTKLQSWYYSKISHYYPTYVPLLFQYR
jgi:hypothetical protein